MIARDLYPSAKVDGGSWVLGITGLGFCTGWVRGYLR